ncbi:MAG: hypothetical protein GTO41_15945, partial [Burkholderiales bacterium]|nr:hypothetical protein [Burkholderiales bacterium]
MHAHNHSLGKNVLFPKALAVLARDGYSMLLQIHDFAEDFRPDNYGQLASALVDNAFERLPDALYPQALHVHYAVLNCRDREILRHAGVDPARLHWIPNAVAETDTLPNREAARNELTVRFGIPAEARLLLYPVRGIRRKNLGETLMWSALADEGTW